MRNRPSATACSMSSDAEATTRARMGTDRFEPRRSTCFCSTNTDSVGLDGTAIRTRSWDSCFDLEFSGLHGHPVRSSPRSRYRQWMTHKLATWHDQFGSSGCVGCGRCITWCPVGIDITEEVAAMSNGGKP